MTAPDPLPPADPAPDAAADTAVPVPRTVRTAWPIDVRGSFALAPAFADSLAPLLDGRRGVELRAPGYRDGTAARTLVEWFAGSEGRRLFAAAALRASGCCPGVYLLLNHPRPGFGGTGRAAADADIDRRVWLPVDVDPVRPKDAGATAAEKASAYHTAVAVRAWLDGRGWPPPLFADSGNGYHLLYPIDLPNDPAAAALVRGVLDALAARFDTPAATVDRRLFNAARVLKVPGTPACKGADTADRPHRTGGWLDTPAVAARVPPALLAAVAAEAPPADPPRPPGGDGPPAGAGLSDDRVLDLCRQFYGAKFDRLWAGDTGGHGDDHSRADLALTAYLAWVAGPDEDRLVALFRRSALYRREKWDAVHSADGLSYGQMTVRRALSSTTSFYTDRRAGRAAAPPPPADGGAPPTPAPDGGVPLKPDDPHRIAAAFLAGHTPDGVWPRLRFYQGQWHRYDGGAYRLVPDDDLRAELTAFARGHLDAVYRGALDGWRAAADRPRRPPEPQPVTTALRANIENALKSLAHLPADTPQPAWLDGAGGPHPDRILAVRNGLLDVATGTLLPPTPAFFTAAAADYQFDPAAPPPARWLRFLDEVFPADPDAVRCLRQVFGYLLTADTRHQKIFALAGEKRGGKGTVLKLLARLVGGRAYAATTLAALAEPFGLQPLLGKTVAGIPDAQFAGRADATAVAVERLKSVSTGEPVAVARKFLDAVTVPLRVRFVIACNELPRLADGSGALASRMVVLPFRVSFLGREDRDLDDALAAELPGVLNWALGGWADLAADGRFAEPASGTELKATFADAGSPVAVFVRERAAVDPAAEAVMDDVYAAYRGWCGAAGESPLSKSAFGAALRAAVPALGDGRPRRGGRKRVYRGLRLLTPDEVAGPPDHPFVREGEKVLEGARW